MIPHDILTLYDVKALEYLISLAFLILFVPFWNYTMGTRKLKKRPERQKALTTAPVYPNRRVPRYAGLYRV